MYTDIAVRIGMPGDTEVSWRVRGKPWGIGMGSFTVFTRPGREHVFLPSLIEKMKQSPGNLI